jgi:hypothetical protein
VTDSDLQVAIAELRADIVRWPAGMGLARAGEPVGILVALP